MHNEVPQTQNIRVSTNASNPVEMYKAEVNRFHTDIAINYARFLVKQEEKPDQSNLCNIFVPDSFDGDWKKVSAVDYYTHLVSIWGFKDEVHLPTGSDVTEVLAAIKKFSSEHLELQTPILKSYDIFNKYASKYGFDVGQYDLNNIIFIPNVRFNKIAGNRAGESIFAHGLAVSKHYNPSAAMSNEILIPTGIIENNTDFRLLLLLLHEFGHKARLSQKLEEIPVGLSEKQVHWIKEGIVNRLAVEIAEAEEIEYGYLLNGYPYETYFVGLLEKKLDTNSLANLSLSEIEDRFNRKFGEQYSFAEFCTTVFRLQESMIGAEAADESLHDSDYLEKIKLLRLPSSEQDPQKKKDQAVRDFAIRWDFDERDISASLNEIMRNNIEYYKRRLHK
ncbi:MAG: hypothetical protein Fur003_6190 [Candidatus Dojkabacteria bacterium]